MSTVPNLEALNAEILAEFPDYKVLYKADSTLMKVINVFLMIITFGQMTSFMVDFVTSIGDTVYLPSNWNTIQVYEQCTVLRHERIHMRQAKKMSRFLFSLVYILLPIPLGLAWGRTKLEMEAYEESLTAWNDYGVDITLPANKALITNCFTTGQYGWMWPFSTAISNWYDAAVKRILG